MCSVSNHNQIQQMAVQLNIPQNISAAEWDLEDETDGESLATTMFEHIQNRTLNIQQCAQIVLHLFQSESVSCLSV